MESFKTLFLRLNEAKYWLHFDHIPSTTDETLKNILKKMEKIVGDSANDIYIDPDYDFENAKGRLQIKISNPEILDLIVSKLSELRFVKTSGGFNSSEIVSIELYFTKGMRGSGKLPRKGEESMSPPSTAQQEMATVYVINSYINGKEVSLEEINEHIGYEFDELWLFNFKEQLNALIRSGMIISSHTCYLDSAKNESNVMIEIAKRCGLKDSKDNWNPADVWLMSISASKVKSDTKDFTTLAEFNTYMTQKFKTKEIIGISLKKITKPKIGKYEVIESDILPQVNFIPNRVIFNTNNKNFIFETSNTEGSVSGFNIRVGTKAGDVKEEKDIKIYLEGRMKNTSVQLGAVSADLFNSMARDSGLDIAEYRSRVLNLSGDKLEKEYDKQISKVKKLKYVLLTETEVNDLQKKLICILAHYLFILNEDNVLNKCYFSAIKKNDFSSIHLKIS